MPSIPFIQYVPPNAAKRPVSIDRAQDVFDKAQAVIDAGYRFEIEVLTLGEGMVSMTVAGFDKALKEENDVAIRVGPNDEKIPQLVDELVEEAYQYIQ